MILEVSVAMYSGWRNPRWLVLGDAAHRLADVLRGRPEIATDVPPVPLLGFRGVEVRGVTPDALNVESGSSSWVGNGLAPDGPGSDALARALVTEAPTDEDSQGGLSPMEKEESLGAIGVMQDKVGSYLKALENHGKTSQASSSPCAFDPESYLPE